ncbi:MAG: GGDEF domain-containing protein [Candidatus Latescibacteria bacterium]|nr:GGDEF domain-containing protein [Candidatus Latescibacterota bacterium]
MPPTEGLPGAPELLNGLKDVLYRNRFDALLLFDIDHFQQVNKTHGRDLGDEVLKAVAGFLKENKWLGYRIGSDEFGVIFSGGNDVSVDVLASLPEYIADKTGVSITLSGGGIQHPGTEFGLDAATAEVLFSSTQHLLTQAKKWGRDRVLWLTEPLSEDVDLSDIALRFYKDLAQVNAALAKEMAVESRTDFLTGLYNRRGFEDVYARMVKRAQRSERPLALLYMDSDSLKTINDTHGHDAGDRFIVDLARILSELLRGNDLVSRWGADEFAAVVENTTREKALSIAERLHLAIAERTAGTMSIAMFYGVPTSPEEALKMADDALYRIKGRGKNDIELVE